VSIPSLRGQVDSLPLGESADFQDLIEEFVLGNEDENFDFNTLLEDIEHYRRRPLDLNKASAEQLREIKLLSDIQINRLLEYRSYAGDLLAIFELQAIPGFDLATIRRILPFVRVGGDAFQSRTDLWSMFTESKQELYLRAGRILESQRGFEPSTGTSTNRFLGDPYNLFMRYRHVYENKLSLGFTAQKDPGEEFFRGSNPYGFDFYSAHFFLRDFNSKLKSLAIGDFAVSFGQGLLIHSGFGARKSAFVMNIKRGARTLRPYTSIDENNFMRGAGITYALKRELELTAFVSYKRRDANIQTDTLEDIDENLSFFTSILASGLHRTPNEIANRGALGHFTAGTSLIYDVGKFRLGWNTLYDRFDQPFERNRQPYNQFLFSGRELLNTSLDYTYIYRNFHFFGETAVSNNGAVATLNGIMAGVDRKMDIAILQRYFPRDYHAIIPNVFAETTLANNEQGIYLGMEIKPDKYWRLSAYVDLWQHPWMRFQVDAPSNGQEYFARLTYTLKRRSEIYIQYRVKTRERNDGSEEAIKNRLLFAHTREQFRLNINNKVSKSLELRTRLETSLYQIADGTPTRGFMVLQDIIYKPIGFPMSFTTRFSVFDVEDFNSRIYAFENDLIYSFSIPAFFNQGMRYYLMLRYRGFKKVSIEARFAQTYYTNIDQIGSGLLLIDGNTRTDVRVQIKYAF
jgi:hypothetical protein